MTGYESIEKDMKHRMEAALSVLASNFSKLRTGRAHSSLVEDIKVAYYGNPTPLNQVANINTPDARTLSIVPYDKGQMNEISAAIRDSDLGLNPNTSADSIIINIPPLNEETRNNYRKHARAEAEQTRVAIRNVRRDVIHKIKEAAASEDEEKQESAKVDKATEEFIGKVEERLQQKEQELMEI